MAEIDKQIRERMQRLDVKNDKIVAQLLELRYTPAMAAGITGHIWKWEDII